MGIQLKSRQVPDQKLYNSIRNETYNKPLPSLKGHYRCDTGVKHDGRQYVIVVAPEKLESKRVKYPNLQIVETIV